MRSKMFDRMWSCLRIRHRESRLSMSWTPTPDPSPQGGGEYPSSRGRAGMPLRRDIIYIWPRQIGALPCIRTAPLPLAGRGRGWGPSGTAAPAVRNATPRFRSPAARRRDCRAPRCSRIAARGSRASISRLRRASAARCQSCCPPSSSITSFSRRLTKSTMNGPMLAWRRKCEPCSAMSRRSRCYSTRSASVGCARIRAANCFCGSLMRVVNHSHS